MPGGLATRPYWYDYKMRKIFVTGAFLWLPRFLTNEEVTSLAGSSCLPRNEPSRESASQCSRHPLTYRMAPTRGSKQAADAVPPSGPGDHPGVDVEIVVPCYNEAHRLKVGDFVAFARAPETRVRLLFVDDGSSDGTLAMLRNAQRACPERIDVLGLKTNVGKAEAVRLGMRRACGEIINVGTSAPSTTKKTQNSAAFVGFWDADLATPLDHIQMFHDVFQSKPEVDMVFGARVGLLGRSIKRSKRRHYMGRVFATLASIALNMPVYDTQCGAKLFRVDADLKNALSEPFDTRWVFDCEIVGRYASLRRGQEKASVGSSGSTKSDRREKEVTKPTGGVVDKKTQVVDSIYEYPLHRWEDVAGSKVKPSDIVKMAWGLARLRVKYFSKIPWAPRKKETGR